MALMRNIGQAKITKINPKPNFIYPTVRFPRDYAELIGHTVTMYDTKDENSGKRAFLLVIDDDSILPEKVAERKLTAGLDSRLSIVETEVKQMRKSVDKLVQELKIKKKVARRKEYAMNDGDIDGIDCGYDS